MTRARSEIFRVRQYMLESGSSEQMNEELEMPEAATLAFSEDDDGAREEIKGRRKLQRRLL
jgi:hypothetical protein